MIRHSSNTSESWKKLPWKKFRKNLFRLQKRIYKAVRVGDKRKVMSLQKLVLKSTSAKLMAIRQVTQLNAGKKTAGIDGKKALNYSERFKLLKLLKNPRWNHQGLRKIPIFKKDGSKRWLSIPTISDRAWQCLAKFALEPAHEATFHANSFGFRTGRSAHDAQKLLFDNLKSNAKGHQKTVIELDISKCFDRISHKAIMDRLIAPKNLKLGIFRCLKAGNNPYFPEQGTHQGGVVSPLLANIVLNDIDFEINDNTPYKCIRYADDMVIILPVKDSNKEKAESIIRSTSKFLDKYGLEVSKKKTKITYVSTGFNFLGWHFKTQSNGKFRSTPSKENYEKFRKKVKAIVNNSNYGAKVKAQKLAPIVRGWRNYHKYCKMNGARNSLWFMSHRAYKVFNKETKQDKHSCEKLINKAFPAVSYSENRHIKVKGDKSPYDGDITYWSQRESKLYDGLTSQMLKKQNHSCGFCGLRFLPGEEIHLHHIDENHKNWKRNNLMAIHRSCHEYQHMGKAIAKNI